MASGSGLPQFVDDYFDLVYTFAVFQHIPDRELIYDYLNDAFRVLKPGGIIAAHFNGAPPAESRCDTWVGAWIPEEDLLSYARIKGWQVLSSEGASTQYLWMTMRKPNHSRELFPAASVRAEVTLVTPSDGASNVVAGGPDGFATVHLRGLPDHRCDIANLGITIGDTPTHIRYIGPTGAEALRQINIHVPEAVPTGRQRLVLVWKQEIASNAVPITVTSCPPLEPRLLMITDGTEITSENVIRSRGMQLTVSGCVEIETLRATVDGDSLELNGTFCEVPLRKQYKVNLLVPDKLTGRHLVSVSVDGRGLGAREVEFGAHNGLRSA